MPSTWLMLYSQHYHRSLSWLEAFLVIRPPAGSFFILFDYRPVSSIAFEHALFQQLVLYTVFYHIGSLLIANIHLDVLISGCFESDILNSTSLLTSGS